MIIDCQLKSLLKNYLKTLIVGFGQADALGLRLRLWIGHITTYICLQYKVNLNFLISIWYMISVYSTWEF